MDRIYDNCCGIDVHKKLIVACFKNGNKQEVREFGATTDVQDIFQALQLSLFQVRHRLIEYFLQYFSTIKNSPPSTVIVGQAGDFCIRIIKILETRFWIWYIGNRRGKPEKRPTLNYVDLTSYEVSRHYCE